MPARSRVDIICAGTIRNGVCKIPSRVFVAAITSKYRGAHDERLVRSGKKITIRARVTRVVYYTLNAVRCWKGSSERNGFCSSTRNNRCFSFHIQEVGVRVVLHARLRLRIEVLNLLLNPNLDRVSLGNSTESRLTTSFQRTSLVPFPHRCVGISSDFERFEALRLFSDFPISD